MTHRAHTSCSRAGISGSEEEYHSLGPGRKPDRDLAIGIILLLQIIVGILGNFSLLRHYLFLYLTECRVRPTDVFLKHLTVANLLVISSKGIPQMMVGLGLKDFLSDLACKLVFYVHRAGRGVAIGTTCLASVFQVIIISPRSSGWAELKVRAPKYRGTSNTLCWALNMMLNITATVSFTGRGNSINITRERDYDYCYSVSGSPISQSLYAVSVLLRDGFCFGLVVWACGSIVFILHQHERRVQYIHRKTLSPRPSPETTATRSTLVLVSTFVSLWTLSSFFHICLVVLNNPSLWLRNASVLLNACFPTVSPYILMSQDFRKCSLCWPCKGTAKSLKLIINM